MISVIMTTYNVEKYVTKAINSILNQTHKNLELIIIDDCSTDNTLKIISEFNDPRIKLYKNKINAGTYFCKNYGISVSRGGFIAIQDSDDYSTPSRLERQINYFKKNPHAVIVKCQYVRVNLKEKILTEPKAAFQASMIKREVYKEIGLYDTVRVAGDDEFDCRAKKYYSPKKVCILPEVFYYNLHRKDSLTNTVAIGGEERTSYVENFKHWHSSCKSKEDLFIPFPHSDRLFDIHPNIDVKNKELFKERFIRIKINGEKVVATVVSFPKREKQFKLVIKDILPQVDRLQVYLNDYKNIPDFLINDKIKVYLGEDFAGDIADNGKLYMTNNLYGFHFTIDDDIKYPNDYVKVLKENLQHYNYECIVGVHGIDILHDQFEHYYHKNSRRVYVYNNKLDNNKEVNILGTGTVAYHTSLFKPNFLEINKPFMVDIFFAIQANRKNIPLICIKRSKNWLGDYETHEQTRIYEVFNKNDEYQTNLILNNPLKKFFTIDNNEIQDIKDTGDNEHHIKKLKADISFKSKELKELEFTINGLKGEKTWYSETYDHLPKWYLKVGGIFRRIKIKKKN